MKTLLLASLLLVTACSSPPIAERTRPVPPGVPAAAPSAPAKVFPVAPITEEATRAWLDQAIERAPVVEPPAPMVQVVERVVERPVASRAPYDPYWNQYDHGGYYAPRYRRSYRRHSSFPLGTALGAGIGAVIGHQSGHRGRGAWIGGSVGYLLDVTTRY